ncbi:glycosyltransferase family 39 protein [Streptomyces albiaxialis]|uniref:Glycosyltransferase family 39 protein n=1 Tax=Streptomyces albiaxialis TaxID=329523 RepID=A0ABP5I1I5_9ACTN
MVTSTAPSRFRTPAERKSPAPPARRPRLARDLTRDSRTVAVLAPALLMLGLGLWGIRRENSMWRDESTTYQVAHRSLPELWHMLGTVDMVHGLHYLFMHAVFAVWDGGLLALRLPAVLAMAAAASAVALTGRRLAGPRAGLAAGLVFPLFPLVQKYAQEGRSYAMVCAAVAWSTYLLLRALERPRPRLWAGYAAVLAVGCLLNELAVLTLLAHGAVLLRERALRPLLWPWSQAAAAVCAVLTPLVVVSKAQEAQLAHLEAPGPAQLLRFALPVLLALLFACARPRRRGPADPRTAALALAVLPPSLLVLVSSVRPLYEERYVVYSAVGLALLGGFAVERVLRALRPWAAGLLTVAVVAALVPLWLPVRQPEVHMDDTNAVADAAREMTRRGDGVLYVPALRREGSLSHPAEYGGLRDLALARTPAASGTLWGVELPEAQIGARVRAAHRVLVLTDPPSRAGDAPFTARDEAKLAALRERFTLCARHNAGHMTLTLYASDPALCTD